MYQGHMVGYQGHMNGIMVIGVCHGHRIDSKVTCYVSRSHDGYQGHRMDINVRCDVSRSHDGYQC